MEDQVPEDFTPSPNPWDEAKTSYKLELRQAIEIKLKVTYASFGQRFLAYLLDVLILLVPSVIVYFIFLGDDWLSPGMALKRDILSIILGGIYYAGLESSDMQATLGKRIMGLRVVNEEGKRLTFLNAVVRYLGKIPSALVAGMGFWTIAWDEHHQGWHDMMAGSFVVRRSAEESV